MLGVQVGNHYSDQPGSLQLCDITTLQSKRRVFTWFSWHEYLDKLCVNEEFVCSICFRPVAAGLLH